MKSAWFVFFLNATWCPRRNESIKVVFDTLRFRKLMCTSLTIFKIEVKSPILIYKYWFVTTFKKMYFLLKNILVFFWYIFFYFYINIYKKLISSWCKLRFCYSLNIVKIRELPGLYSHVWTGVSIPFFKNKFYRLFSRINLIKVCYRKLPPPLFCDEMKIYPRYSILLVFIAGKLKLGIFPI